MVRSKRVLMPSTAPGGAIRSAMADDLGASLNGAAMGATMMAASSWDRPELTIRLGLSKHWCGRSIEPCLFGTEGSKPDQTAPWQHQQEPMQIQDQLHIPEMGQRMTADGCAVCHAKAHSTL